MISMIHIDSMILTNRSRISCDFRRQGEEHDYSEVGGRTFLIYKDHAVSTDSEIFGIGPGRCGKGTSFL